MKHKIAPLIMSFVLISFSALCQTTENTSHPKLDAFRKLKQNSQAANDSIAAASTTAASNLTTSPNPEPVAPSTTGKIGTNPNLSPTPVANITPATTTVVTKAPEQSAVSQPKPHIYMDTRLGSSTKQYDTYEKNNYGAGSVTTSPK